MNKTNPTTTILTIVLALAFIAIGWLASSLRHERDSAYQSRQALVEEKQNVADAQERAEDAKLKITWPTRGSNLCYEQQYSISWNAPLDMDIVTVNLISPSYTTSLGDHAAVNGRGDFVGYGSYTWDLTDLQGNIVPAADVYKIAISGVYHNRQISTTTDGVFAIKNCNQ